VPGFFLENAAEMLYRTIGALLLVLALTPARADILVGKVVAVADGDTITVLDDSRVQHTIRLAGIDAPERKQPFGQRAKEQLSALVFGKTVQVETDKTDRYGRQVGKVVVDGRDANLAMVTSGMAWHYKKYQTEQAPSDRLLYASAEEDARGGRLGLWREPAPVAPWDWRRGERQAGQ
jgi:endonuclease YncB( thermonuclease family)